MNIMNLLYSRWTSFICLLICLFLLGFSAYLQLNLALLPCPLCVLQRAMVVVIAFIFFIGSLYTPFQPNGKRWHSILLIIASILGAIVAAHHMWLQHQPPGTVVACSPTLNYILHTMSWDHALSAIYSGSGDCAINVWEFMHLSIPEWTFVFFTLFGLLGIVRFLVVTNELK